MRGLMYIIFVGVGILLLEFVHFGQNEISSGSTRQIVLIYEKPSRQVDIKNDSIELDTIIIVSDSTVIEKKLSDSTFFSQLIQRVISEKEDRKNLPVIRYYAKPMDGEKVYPLREYGYYIHERESMNLDAYASNSISYGDLVSKEDLLLIVYVLIAQGVDIKKVSLSKYHAGWKYHSVEIGTDTTVIGNPSITLSDLRKRWSDM